jgi:hypothetical protein
LQAHRLLCFALLGWRQARDAVLSMRHEVARLMSDLRREAEAADRLTTLGALPPVHIEVSPRSPPASSSHTSAGSALRSTYTRHSTRFCRSWLAPGPSHLVFTSPVLSPQGRLAAIDEMLALAAHGRPTPDDADSKAHAHMHGAEARPRTRMVGTTSGRARWAGVPEPSVERLAELLGGKPADVLEAQHLRSREAAGGAQEWVLPSFKRLKERHFTLQLLLIKHYRRGRETQLLERTFRAWHALVARSGCERPCQAAS